MLQLKPGVSRDTLNRLLANLASTRKIGFDTPGNVGIINVPPGTESKAIDHAYRDPNVLRAGLDLERVSPVTPM